jgi:myo-inositol 2-dehydrogenase / D-chiro-inositol 1-dehydrogenase
MMIHDFDLARFILDEDPVEIRAVGSSLVSPEIGALGDVDTAMTVMKTPSGVLCHINCSRRSVYGYDQRVEAFGSDGMLISGNRTATSLERWGKHATAARDPLLAFFIERYAESYRAEVAAFIDSVEQGRQPSPSFEDGRRAMILADAAGESMRSGRAVQPTY